MVDNEGEKLPSSGMERDTKWQIVIGKRVDTRGNETMGTLLCRSFAVSQGANVSPSALPTAVGLGWASPPPSAFFLT
jgi:hypothetical protein